MAKYFECTSEQDQRIILDDSFKNLELLKTVPMNQLPKVDSGGATKYYNIPFPEDMLPNDPYLLGFSLSGLSGKRFCISFGVSRRIIEIYDPGLPYNQAVYPVFRDDITSASTLYIFGLKNRTPSPHLTGIEIYNESGAVLYSSGAQYLDVTYCGGDEALTLSYDAQTIALPLGEDIYVDIHGTSHQGFKGIESHTMPTFTVSDSTVTVSKTTFNQVYTDYDDDGQYNPGVVYEREASYAYGYMLARVV